jgi:hypothetical protein
VKRRALVVVVLVACSREESRTTVTIPTTSATSPSIASVSPSALDASASNAKRCLPVVAAECGCVYTCGSGEETSPGKWKVTHQYWAPSILDAKVSPWCVAGDCTDAFRAQIVCDVVCAPKPADHTCHFEADRCVSGQKP